MSIFSNKLNFFSSGSNLIFFREANQSYHSAVDSRGAGGAIAPTEFGGSEKRQSLISAYWSLAITKITIIDRCISLNSVQIFLNSVQIFLVVDMGHLLLIGFWGWKNQNQCKKIKYLTLLLCYMAIFLLEMGQN